MIFHNNCVVDILSGDNRKTLKSLKGANIQTCVTSPPYYGLRDYGHDGQIGLEQTPEAYINQLVEVFRLVRDALADDGTLWLNIGDSYSSHKDCKSIGQTLAKGTSRENAHVMDLGKSRVRDSKMLKSQGFKNKDLIGIPWMLAFALRADGWYLRQDIIWHKPNPMPESVKDRCTKAHEYIFLLSKSDKYYFNVDAIKEPAVMNRWGGKKSINIKNSKDTDNQFSGLTRERDMMPETRNKRSVWKVTTKPYKGAHFAVFPVELIEPCILAGSKVGDFVLDPFGGSGTVGGGSLKHGRHAILCELNPSYVDLMRARIEDILK